MSSILTPNTPHSEINSPASSFRRFINAAFSFAGVIPALLAKVAWVSPLSRMYLWRLSLMSNPPPPFLAGRSHGLPLHLASKPFGDSLIKKRNDLSHRNSHLPAQCVDVGYSGISFSPDRLAHLLSGPSQSLCQLTFRPVSFPDGSSQSFVHHFLHLRSKPFGDTMNIPPFSFTVNLLVIIFVAFLVTLFYNDTQGGAIMNFGEKLKIIRQSLGLNQQELADRLGTTKQAISRYENSERDPNLRTAKSFSDKLGIDIALLADDSLYLPTAQKIKSERITRGYSIAQLSSMIHISPERLSAIESGEIFPTSLEVASLSKKLFLSSDYLLGLGFEIEKEPVPLSDFESEILSLFRELDPQKRSELLDFARQLSLRSSSPSVSELEEEYIKSRSSSVSRTDLTASSTTDAERASGD